MLWSILAMLTAAPLPAAAPAGPAVYVEQGADAVGRKHVLLLDANGISTGLFSLVAHRGPGAGRLNLKQGYWLYCGRWRAEPGDRLVVHERMAESFSYPAPADAAVAHDRTYQGSGAQAGRWRSQMTGEGRRYTLSATPPIEPAALPGPRFVCAQADHPAGRASSLALPATASSVRHNGVASGG